jgi:hypothetical protein
MKFLKGPARRVCRCVLADRRRRCWERQHSSSEDLLEWLCPGWKQNVAHPIEARRRHLFERYVDAMLNRRVRQIMLHARAKLAVAHLACVVDDAVSAECFPLESTEFQPVT